MGCGVLCPAPVFTACFPAGTHRWAGGCAAGVKAAAGHLTGLTAYAAAAAHAGLYAAGLGCCGGEGAAAGGQIIAAVRRQVGRGEEYEPGIAQCLTAVRGAAAAADGERAALGERAAAAVPAEAACAAEAEEHAGLLRGQAHAHAAAAARRQHGAAGDADGPVGIQGLVVGAADGPHGHGAAADVQIAVGVEAVAAGGIGRDGAAADVYGEVVAA